MRIRKQICIFLIPLLGFSFFTAGAAAKSGCNDNACQKMAAKAAHSHARNMALASDCCARHQQAPCELERRQTQELSAFSVSAFRLDNFRSVSIIHPTDHTPIDRHTVRELQKSFATEVTARSSPIYLKNLTLIC